MDVEATLTELQALVTGCLRTGYGQQSRTERAEWTGNALAALELFEGLDEHLTRGGYLPSGWAR